MPGEFVVDGPEGPGMVLLSERKVRYLLHGVKMGRREGRAYHLLNMRKLMYHNPQYKTKRQPGTSIRILEHQLDNFSRVDYNIVIISPNPPTHPEKRKEKEKPTIPPPKLHIRREFIQPIIPLY